MGSENGLGAVGAVIPLLAPDPVATLHDSAAPTLPLPAAAPVATQTEAATLSVTGKLLAALLQAAPSAERVSPMPPMMAKPSAEPAVIASAIRNGIEHSGLFYESHLAEWVTGQRELDALRQEPQSRGNATDDVPAILRQQLEMLDSQPLQWRGELWPGLALQLRIDRQAAQAREGAPDETPDTWSSTLLSELPALGSVVAKLRIEGDRLQLKLQATGDASALLASRSEELRNALAAAGLRLQRFDADGERST